jgi:hypothetical protein
MTSLLRFNAIAASRGDGLHPKLRDLFERTATFHNSDVVHHNGMLQAGPPLTSSTSSMSTGDTVSPPCPTPRVKQV